MSLASTTMRGRAFAEAQMIDAVTITRATGAVDELTGASVSEQVYAGKARVQTYEAQEAGVEVGAGSVTAQRYTVHIPVGAFAPEVDDLITITTATLDPNLTGRQYVVRALLHKSAATAYRLGVEDNDGFGGAS